ncbi:MAG: hypothetical protein WC132_06725 [Methanomethylophilus sp.]
MDLEKLKRDWAEDPQLKFYAFDRVEELADHLRRVHSEMMKGGHGCFGYLYRQQTLRVKQLMKELEDARRK